MPRLESAFLPEYYYILLLRGICSVHTSRVVAYEHRGQHCILKLPNRIRGLGIGVCAVERPIPAWTYVFCRRGWDLHT